MKSYCTISILLGLVTILNSNLSEARKHSGKRNIFKSPYETDVSQIKGTSTPWVQEKYVKVIDKFKKELFDDLKKSYQVQRIWNVKTNSSTTRCIYFKQPTRFLTDLGHPVPQAVANIISKSASLHNLLDMPIFFEVIAVNLGEFLLTHKKDPNEAAAKKYVAILNAEFQKVNANDFEAVWLATLNAYAEFVKSCGFKLIDVIDELLEGFASGLIVQADK